MPVVYWTNFKFYNQIQNKFLKSKIVFEMPENH